MTDCYNKYVSRIINYAEIRNSCFFNRDVFADVDISVIIPVRSRTHFNHVVTKCLMDAMDLESRFSYAITFVEHSPSQEHVDLCCHTNYVHIPTNEVFNKCLAFNIGALYCNQAKFYMFHDLDVIMKPDFFNNLYENFLRTDFGPIQSFTLRRVQYVNEQETGRVLNGQIDINSLRVNGAGIVQGRPPAPGGSLVIPHQQFFDIGGYDAELFFGYSIEDQFFYDKLLAIGPVHSCDNPVNEMFHLWHTPLWNSNPHANEHHALYHSFKNYTTTDKLKYLSAASANLKKYKCI